MISLGDFVQYRTAMGQLKGYGLIVRRTEHWIILLDQETRKEVYWPEDLMVRIIK